MSTPEEFITKFHSIEGDTIAARRKQFFTLLHHSFPILAKNPEALKTISENLTPKTYLEKLFQVEFLIYFQRRPELLKILKEGNDVFVSKIIKQVWFFTETFDGIEAEELVIEVLPCMSFVVRMKVLRKLSRYIKSEKFDSIFDAVVRRYGIYIATKFITGCTPGKVRTTIETYPLKLNSTQLRILYKKDPGFIEFYFGKSVHSIQHHAYKNLVKFIYKNDPNLYDRLNRKYFISLKLGRRATKKFVVDHKNEVIKDPSMCDYLNKRAVIRKLGTESVQLFINSLPPKLDESPRLYWIVNSFPKKYHYSLIFKTFQTHFRIKFIDHPSYITEELLGFVSDNSERALLAKVKVDEGCDNFMKYLTTADSIPLIKEKINLTSDINERGNLIRDMIESCHINNDITALYSVMQYFCFRHKNDDLSVHLQFIRNIESLFGFKKFNEEMWNCLNELLMIHMLKFDQSETTYKKIQTMPLLSFNIGTSRLQKLSYLEFLFLSGKPIDDLLTDYFTRGLEFPHSDSYDNSFVKYVLFFAIDKFAEESIEDKPLRQNCLLINEILQWNLYNKDDELSFYDFPKLLFTFNYCLRNNNFLNSYVYGCLKKYFLDKIFTTHENSLRKEYLEVYWQRFDLYGNLSNIQWFLKYDPLKVVDNFDKIFELLIIALSKKRAPEFPYWYLMKKFSHLHLDVKIIETCLSKLTDDTSFKTKFIPCLSILMKPEDFAAVAETYKPANKKLDLKNENEVKLYQLQCIIATSFKNTKSHEVLKTLLPYCAGDYFKYAMPSLYSILYRTPENRLPEYLNYLSTKAVSVRKHALYLTCELSTNSKIENMIKLLNKQEGVQSLQKQMFSTTIKYFVKNPSDQFFEMVKLNMVFINKTDQESLDGIADNFSKIPKKYQAQYIEYSWDFLETTVKVSKKLQPLKEKLLRCLNPETVTQLRLEFGLTIIEKHFFTLKRLSNIEMFVFDFIILREEKEVILTKVFSILDKCESKDEMYKFLLSWYYKVMSLPDRNITYMDPFITYFEKYVTLDKTFNDYIKIHFLKEKVRLSQSFSIDDFVTRLISFFHDIVAKCGPHVTNLFAKEMSSNLTHFTSNRIYIFHFYHSMIQNHSSSIVAVLIIYAMNFPSFRKIDETKLFHEILRRIKEIEDLGVQINLYSKFKSTLMTESFLNSCQTEMEVDS